LRAGLRSGGSSAARSCVRGAGTVGDNLMSERLGKLDLFFVVDNTGSMGPYINAVKQKILEIVRTIKREELCHHLRIGLVCYRDHPPQESTFVTRKFELTSDTAAIEASVKEMSASGGGDGPEAVADAIHVLNRMEFLRDAAKVAVLVGDAPPHGVEPGDAWSECPEGIDWREEAKKAFDAGIVVHTVGCFPEIQRYTHAVDTFKEIASTTKGEFFPLAEAEGLVELITGIAVEEIDKIAIQESILKELGIDPTQVDTEVLSSVDASELARTLSGKGVTRRVVRTTAADTPAPVELQEAEISEEDVLEAIRQIRKKME